MAGEEPYSDEFCTMLGDVRRGVDVLRELMIGHDRKLGSLTRAKERIRVLEAQEAALVLDLAGVVADRKRVEELLTLRTGELAATKTVQRANFERAVDELRGEVGRLRSWREEAINLHPTLEELPL